MPVRSITRHALQVFATAVAVTAGPMVSTAASAQDKVVFQVTEADPARGNLIFNNVRNLQEGASPDAEIEVVAFGPGVMLLKADSPLAARIADAVDHHVRVVACENTMANAKLTKGEMLPSIGYVPAGVVEVMRKQQQGFAYIRP